MHIDMKLNFMHILANLGFDGVYPIYWIKKSKHAIRYTYSKYACTRLSRTKGDIIWTKHQINQEGTPKCDTTKGCPNYIKEPNQHMKDPKFNKWTRHKPKSMSDK